MQDRLLRPGRPRRDFALEVAEAVGCGNSKKKGEEEGNDKVRN